ncbi:hypothetical protein EVAR_4428_1 [Eumeta japonica]|uniref:Uncharacterized protein n=1 Tax=Eumeta variegata TaxID=151549 RepID=A0A4C1SYF9_EUMVA|nr:hypothetical protein EVAR_4428_1 [Eumeta japonica]
MALSYRIRPLARATFEPDSPEAAQQVGNQTPVAEKRRAPPVRLAQVLAHSAAPSLCTHSSVTVSLVTYKKRYQRNNNIVII